MTITSIGFTGTREGMTEDQRLRVLELLLLYNPLVAHHGGCVGADEQFHKMCVEASVRVTVWPGFPKNSPDDRTHRADIEQWEMVHVMDGKPFLDRNQDIVRACDLLIAAPRDNSKKGGTWWTIKYAEANNREVKIILPGA